MKSIKSIFVLWLTALAFILLLFALRMVQEGRMIRDYEQVVLHNDRLMAIPAQARQITSLVGEYYTYYDPGVLDRINRSGAALLSDLELCPAPGDAHDCLFFHRSLTNVLEEMLVRVNASAQDGDPYQVYYNERTGLHTQGKFLVTQSEQFALSMVTYGTGVYEKILLSNRNYEQTANLFAILLLGGVGLSLVATGRSMLHDIRQISRQSLLLSGGNRNAAEIEKSRYSEIGNVVKALDVMGRNITANILLQQEKLALEQRYNEEKIQSMQKDRLLREAKIQALQMQINPHFLFNTLNMVSRSALLEDHRTTISLIEAISNIMRYTMSIGTSSSLKDELNALRSYLDIQIVRFQDTIDFSLKTGPESDFAEVQLPPLVIQPIVENAILHGVADVPRHGKVDIRVNSGTDCVTIQVEDNGEGIPPQRLEQIRAALDRTSQPKTSGIGMGNVAKRLENFFNRKDLFTIASEFGRGTTVTLVIPKGGVRF